MINKRSFICVGREDDIARIQGTISECKAQFDDAPAEKRVGKRANSAEHRPEKKENGNIKEEVEPFCSDAQVFRKEQEYAHKEQQDQDTCVQQEWDRYFEVKGTSESVKSLHISPVHMHFCSLC